MLLQHYNSYNIKTLQHFKSYTSYIITTLQHCYNQQLQHCYNQQLQHCYNQQLQHCYNIATITALLQYCTSYNITTFLQPTVTALITLLQHALQQLQHYNIATLHCNIATLHHVTTVAMFKGSKNECSEDQYSYLRYSILCFHENIVPNIICVLVAVI